MTRVVITGLGALTPVGNDVGAFWRSMKAGVSGAAPVAAFDASDFPTTIACEVKGFDPKEWMDVREARRFSRASQLSLASARQALADSGLDLAAVDRTRVGVVFNTGGGGMTAIAEGERKLIEKGHRAVSPFLNPNAMPNSVSALISIELGIAGPVITSTLACAAGSYALLDAARHVERGEVDAVVAGGCESAVIPAIFASFARMGALSPTNDPEIASRPFDRERDGFVFGEGAAAFIVESEESARSRGARIYAWILGGAATADAYHITAPEPEGIGASLAMTRTLRSAALEPTAVDAIFAHATSTPLGDIAETRAIKRALGAHAAQVAVSATKSQLGHTFGAAGAMSALAAVKALEEQVICPTVHYATPDPECDLDCVPNEARAMKLERVLVNAFGFGGQNVVLALGAQAPAG
jgi:3-oxoacyl-[acyl-carrier-protein] synthase II